MDGRGGGGVDSLVDEEARAAVEHVLGRVLGAAGGEASSEDFMVIIDA